MLKFEIDGDDPVFALKNCTHVVDMIRDLVSGRTDMQFMEESAILGLTMQLSALSDAMNEIGDMVRARLSIGGEIEPRLTKAPRAARGAA